MRVCKQDATHDLSEAEPWSRICPICGHDLIEVEEPKVVAEPEAIRAEVVPTEPPPVIDAGPIPPGIPDLPKADPGLEPEVVPREPPPVIDAGPIPPGIPDLPKAGPGLEPEVVPREPPPVIDARPIRPGVRDLPKSGAEPEPGVIRQEILRSEMLRPEMLRPGVIRPGVIRPGVIRPAVIPREPPPRIDSGSNRPGIPDPPQAAEEPEPEVVPVQPARELPDPALICARNPEHDISGRAHDATTCPQPQCGGMLIQLECENDLAHDVSRRAPGRFTCPVCGGRLLTPVCGFDASHSMVERDAGQTACPVPSCGHTVNRVVYEPPRQSAEPPLRQQEPPLRQREELPPPPPAWWKDWRILAGGLAAVVGLALLLVWMLLPGPPPDRCAAVPKTMQQAVAKVSERLKAGISAADADTAAHLYLSCGSPEAALLLLRRAFEEGDAGAARMMGELFDPTAGPNVVGRQPANPTRAVEWYARALKAHDAAARPDLERLAAWLRSRPDRDNPEPAALIGMAQEALKGSAK
jgi:hypothetical protein